MANATSQHSLGSLPKATCHQVEHLFDSPLTFQEYAEHLEQHQQQLFLLRSLFIAIQSANNDKQWSQNKHLSVIGAQISETWINNISARRSALDASYSRSSKKS